MRLRVVASCVAVLLSALGTSACESRSPAPDFPVEVDGEGNIALFDPLAHELRFFSPEYRITRVRLDGDTTMVLMREFEPTPFSPSKRDSLSAAIRSVESQFGVNVGSEMRPEAIPVLRWLTPDDEGRLWVCATGLEPCTELDVFDRSGYFLGTVRMPEAVADVPLPLIRDGRIYAAIEGEFGEPQLWVGRVVTP